jgi:hypothetical protein
MPKRPDGSCRHGDITSAAIVAELDRIVAHPSFVQAPQLCRLLQYVVQRTLADEQRELKEYAVGIAVFNRGRSFDPRVDNVVRANARRLRRRLEAYYQGDGHDDPVVIELPKGHYTIRPHANGSIAQSATPHPPLSRTPRVWVRSAETSEDLRQTAAEVVDEILVNLTKMKALDASLTAERADYELSCVVLHAENSLRVSIRLVALRDAAVLWAQSFEQALPVHRFNAAVLVAHMVDSVIDADVDYRAMDGFDEDARRELTKGQIEWRSWVLGAGGSARVAAEHWRAALRREPRLWRALAQMVAHLANRIDHPPLDQCIGEAHAAVRELLALRKCEHLYPHPVMWAHVTGMVNFRLDLDYQLAEQCLERAKVQGWDPGQVDSELGNVYAAAGRLHEAVRHCEDAIARDAQLNQTMTWVLLGRTQIAMRQSRAATENFEAAMNASLPGTRTHLMAQLELIEALWGMGRASDAETVLAAAWGRYGEQHPQWFAPAFALLEHPQQAESLQNELVQRYREGRIYGLYPIFATYALLGDSDKAFVWLDRVIDNREVFRFVTIRHAPHFEPLRADPRFNRTMCRLDALEAQGSPLRPLIEEALNSD